MAEQVSFYVAMQTVHAAMQTSRRSLPAAGGVMALISARSCVDVAQVLSQWSARSICPYRSTIAVFQPHSSIHMVRGFRHII